MHRMGQRVVEKWNAIDGHDDKLRASHPSRVLEFQNERKRDAPQSTAEAEKRYLPQAIPLPPMGHDPHDAKEARNVEC
jgi:hypothetical protein